MFVIARTTPVEYNRRDGAKSVRVAVDRTTIVTDAAQGVIEFDTAAEASAHIAGIPLIGNRSFDGEVIGRPRFRVINLDAAPAYIDDLLAFGGAYERRRAGAR